MTHSKKAKNSEAQIPEQLREMDEEQLAKEANESHLAVMGALRTAIHAAKRAGDALRAMKARKRHGSWMPWVRDHFHASYQTAAVYMRISAHWRSIKKIAAENSGLTLEAALVELSDSSDGTSPPPPPPLPPPPKDQVLRSELKERYLIKLEKWTEEQLEFLLEVTDNFPSRLEECLEVTLSKMEPKE